MSEDPFSFKMENLQEVQQPEKVTDTVKNLTVPQLFPKTKFNNWTGFTEIQIPAARNKYFFKTNYDINEVRPLANALAASGKIKKYGNTIFASSVGEKGQLGAIMFFETNTGYFHYSSYPGIDLPESSLDLNSRIYALLKKLDIYDQSMQITAAYKKKSFEGSVFYEIKRNWALIGLPIYNPIGLLNVRENTKISEVNFNSNSSLLNVNDDIYNTSDGTDSIERRSDFNTLTIQISEKNNKVISIISNLRKIATKSNDVPLIPYNDAVEALQKEENQYILTTPGGDGKEVPWDKIYPGQKAEAEVAEVTESVLAYLENSPGISQSTLEPFYIFRGKANLKSGYLTDFIAVLPATRQPARATTGMIPFSIFPAAYAQDATQKQGAIDLITATPNLTPTPVINFALLNCFPTAAELNPSYELRSYSPPNNGIVQNITFGFSHKAIINGQVSYSRKGWWYMIPAPNSDVNILRYDVDKVLLAIKSITGRRDYRDFLNVLGQGIYPDFQVTGSSCPIRVTGESPTVFVYAPANTTLAIAPHDRLIYADPPIDHGYRWHIKMEAGGELFVNNSNKRKYLYYEYPSEVKFSRPANGWNVNRDDIDNFVNNILSKSLKLRKNESTRMIFELKHAASSVTGSELFVGLIDPVELENSLDLKIYSEGNVFQKTRIHVYVGKKISDDIEEPKINPIIRHEKLVLEIGAWGEHK